jgi:hypothetical protein
MEYFTVKISIFFHNTEKSERFYPSIARFCMPLGCKFVKQIGQGRKRGRLWEQPNEEDA